MGSARINGFSVQRGYAQQGGRVGKNLEEICFREIYAIMWFKEELMQWLWLPHNFG
jgi:hypothetical protein